MATDIKDLPENFLPIVYKIDESKDEIFKYNENPLFGNLIVYPAFALGFQHFIHQTRNTLIEKTGEFEGKKKVYNVVHHFERFVDDYDADINNITKAYFDIDPRPNIIDRRFYDLWELMFMFNLIDLESKNFTSAHLSEGDGSFIQSVLLYRDKFSKSSKSDTYHYISLFDDEKETISDEFMNYYKKEKTQRVFVTKMNNVKGKVDLVTANGTFNWTNINIQEIDSYKIILPQIMNALNIQSKKGNFVLKVYDTYTFPMAKIISLLTSFYSSVYVTKPLMSRLSDQEKYIVCLNYNPDDKKLTKLENIVKTMETNKNKNLIDIFPNYNIDSSFQTNLIALNREISNRQFVTSNQIIDFINKQNYRGDDYTNYRNIQIEASKIWLDLFFPSSKEFNSKKKDVEKLTKNIIDKKDESIKKLQSKLNL